MEGSEKNMKGNYERLSEENYIEIVYGKASRRKEIMKKEGKEYYYVSNRFDATNNAMKK